MLTTLQVSSLTNNGRAMVCASVPQRLRVLRLSVTDLCNFRCCYCMPAVGITKALHSSLCSLEELAGIVEWLTHHTGIETVRITGGEPLVREGVEDLISQLACIPRIRDITLTTNGSLLRRMAWGLKAAGVSRVNISLDSLDEKRFAEITRGGRLSHTLEGIAAGKRAGFTPVKINSVLQRSNWQEEVPRLLDYAAENELELRFIELMRTGTEKSWCQAEFISVEEVCGRMGLHLIPFGVRGMSPAFKTIVNWRGAEMNVGWIMPRSHPFCASCERLRMDACGRIRRCLMDPKTLDLPALLHLDNESTAVEKLNTYLDGKVHPRTMDTSLAMSQIGG